MKRLIPALAAAAVAAVLLLRPLAPPAADPSGWSVPLAETAAPRARRTAPPRALVYVAGDVVHPGVYAVRPDARVADALALAGGARGDADVVAVNLAARVRDGDEIAVPARGAAAAPGAAGSRRSHRHARRTGGPRRGTHGAHRRTRRDEPPPVAEVDINSADAETLATIPGIGDGLAERIVAFRQQNGAFASIDELLDVAGITEHRLDAMLPYVVAR